jgi:hypothetical protein
MLRILQALYQSAQYRKEKDPEPDPYLRIHKHCRHYFRPLNTFMRKVKDPEPDPDPQLWLAIGTVYSVMDNFRICWDDLGIPYPHPTLQIIPDPAHQGVPVPVMRIRP